MMSGVRQGMGVLDGMVIVEGKAAVLGLNLGRSIVTNGTLQQGCSQITFGSTCFLS